MFRYNHIETYWICQGGILILENNHFPRFRLNKGMPRNRASLCILSLNFTSLLTLIRILLFPCLKLFLPLVTGIEFLNFRHKESGEGINDGLRQFDLVWILTLFLTGHGVIASTAKPLQFSSAHPTLLPGNKQFSQMVPVHRRRTDHFKT